VTHDPRTSTARAIAAREDVYPIGLFYRNDHAVCYDDFTSRGLAHDAGGKTSGDPRGH
jgi:hypothetical protein